MNKLSSFINMLRFRMSRKYRKQVFYHQAILLNVLPVDDQKYGYTRYRIRTPLSFVTTSAGDLIVYHYNEYGEPRVNVHAAGTWRECYTFTGEML